MAALAPIPSAKVKITVIARPLVRDSERKAIFRSLRNNWGSRFMATPEFYGAFVCSDPRHSRPRGPAWNIGRTIAETALANRQVLSGATRPNVFDRAP